MKIGVFGGAFDPVHIGHSLLAEKISMNFSLDKFIFIPSAIPPHKSCHTATGIQRFEMLKIVADKLGDGFEVSDIEIKSESVSYTFNTLNILYNKYENAELYFIAGSDIFATIKSWKNFEELFNLAKFIIVKREGVDFKQMFDRIGEGLQGTTINNQNGLHDEKDNIILFDTHIPHISSSFIRENINNSVSFIDEDVFAYIKKNKIY